MNDNRLNALVVGLGVAGMATALRLADTGWNVTIIERAADRRTGGYMVGMFPQALRAAEALGVNDAITKRTQPDVTTLQIDPKGRRETGLGFTGQPGSPELVLRSDIEAGLWSQLPDDISVRFDTTPVAIEQTPNKALVALKHGASDATSVEEFDLVVGADGLRSTVRRLAFDGDHLVPVNAMVCAFQMRGQLPGLAENESAIVAEPGRALWNSGPSS